MNPAVCPSGVETVTVPCSSIDTTELGLTSRTAFKIFSLSSGCKASGSLTITLSIGRLMSLPPPALSKSASVFVKSAFVRFLILPFGNVTSKVPSSFNSILVSGGFTAAIAFLISVIFSSLRGAVPSGTITLLAGTRTELIAAIAFLAASLTLSTLAFFLAAAIASSDAFLTSSTSA
ncbi:hypothetical protein SMIDD26_00114 [Streptococcus mitis]|uniref:Uncharacterized protein n=1 Tax=Streptococcus mitis TaxID=28037 RepID=A0A139Q0K8_STRMT|nr:hypothetical protein SMIDD26_00114 [Streptococcus mitis]